MRVLNMTILGMLGYAYALPAVHPASGEDEAEPPTTALPSTPAAVASATIAATPAANTIPPSGAGFSGWAGLYNSGGYAGGYGANSNPSAVPSPINPQGANSYPGFSGYPGSGGYGGLPVSTAAPVSPEATAAVGSPPASFDYSNFLGGLESSDYSAPAGLEGYGAAPGSYGSAASDTGNVSPFGLQGFAGFGGDYGNTVPASDATSP
ncbi:hypothetical protein BJY04DRAFT_224339 [Aspergillus karnatakaensis]|uniref:uncharacterized protein n=1 Tax=Aspergillus karnatakaensis TaxID=1810916 RepID=UPI003CCCA81D